MTTTITLHKGYLDINSSDWELIAHEFEEIFLQFGQKVLDPGLVQQAREQERAEYYDLRILKNKQLDKYVIYGHHFTPYGKSNYPKYCGAKATESNLEEKLTLVTTCLGLPPQIEEACLKEIKEEN